MVGLTRLVTLLLLTAAPCPNPGIGSQPTHEDPRPPYWADHRLEVAVGFPDNRRYIPRAETTFYRPVTREEASGAPPPDGEPRPTRVLRLVASHAMEGKEAVKTLSAKTGVRLILAGEAGWQLLAMPATPVPVRELMDQIGQAYGAPNLVRWYQMDKDTWVLARGQQEARWASMPLKEAIAAARQNNRDLLLALSQGPQWQALARDMTLTTQMLTPAQRAALATYMRIAFYDSGDDVVNIPTAAAATGQGIMISLGGTGNAVTLSIRAPGVLGEYLSALTFYDTDGSLMWGVPPPR